MPSRLLRLAVTTALAAAAAPVAFASPVASAAHGSKRVVALAGAPHYLVYARAGSGSSAVVYAQDRHHHDRKLGRFNLAGTDTTRFSLVGAVLVGYVWNAVKLDPTKVRWWNLAHHRSGTITVPKGASIDGAARGGVLYELRSKVDPAKPATVVRERTSGKKTTLPRSFGDPDVAYLGGPRGVVAVDYDRATLAMKYARYGHPFRNLAGGGAFDTNDHFTCDAVDAAFVTCAKHAHGGGTNGYGVPLDGGAAVVVGANRVVALGATLVYGGHRLRFRSGDGTVRRSRTHGPPVTSAVGGVIVANHSQTALRLLTGPHATAKTLVRAA